MASTPYASCNRALAGGCCTLANRNAYPGHNRGEKEAERDEGGAGVDVQPAPRGACRSRAVSTSQSNGPAANATAMVNRTVRSGSVIRSGAPTAVAAAVMASAGQAGLIPRHYFEHWHELVGKPHEREGKPAQQPEVGVAAKAALCDEEPRSIESEGIDHAHRPGASQEDQRHRGVGLRNRAERRPAGGRGVDEEATNRARAPQRRKPSGTCPNRAWPARTRRRRQHAARSAVVRGASRGERTAEDRRPELVDRAHHPHGEPSEDSCVGRSHELRVFTARKASEWVVVAGSPQEPRRVGQRQRTAPPPPTAGCGTGGPRPPSAPA